MNESRAHISIIDDDDVVRDGLVSILEGDDREIHAYATARQFLQSAPFLRPGCVILDLKIGQTDGEEVQSQLLKDSNPLPVIVATGYATVSVSVRTMEQGAVTLLEKPIEPVVLQQYVAESIAFDRMQTESHHRFSRLDLIWSSMTERQHSVLVLVVDGIPNKTIARRLEVSQRTVEIERSRLLEIFQVDSTAELIVKATEYRLLVRARNRPVRMVPVLRDVPGIRAFNGSTKTDV